MDRFTTKYIKRLNALQAEGKCNILEIRQPEDMDWPIQGLGAPDISFVCTRHVFSEKGFDKGKGMDVYHVFIQIKKSE